MRCSPFVSRCRLRLFSFLHKRVSRRRLRLLVVSLCTLVSRGNAATLRAEVGVSHCRSRLLAFFCCWCRAVCCDSSASYDKGVALLAATPCCFSMHIGVAWIRCDSLCEKWGCRNVGCDSFTSMCCCRADCYDNEVSNVKVVVSSTATPSRQRLTCRYRAELLRLFARLVFHTAVSGSNHL